jgi:hypothetical protein
VSDAGYVIVGGLRGSWLTQFWIGRRERGQRRDDLRLDLYLEVVDIVLDNELAIAKRGRDAAFPPEELQVKRIRIEHRLKLLGSPQVQAAFRAYSNLVFQETTYPEGYRPADPFLVLRGRMKEDESPDNQPQS